MGQTGRRIWRWIAGTLAVVAILSALAVAGLRVAFDRLPGYQAEAAARVKALTGLELRFSRLDARLGWYGPEILFEDAAVLAPDGRTVLVSARAGRVSFSLWRSAWNRRIEVGRVSLEAPRLNLVIFPDAHVELVGQASVRRPATGGNFDLGKLRHGRLLIHDATLRFEDLRSNEAWEVTDVNLDLTRDGAGLHFGGHVDLPRRLGTSIDLDGEALGDLGAFAGVRWQLRATARNADLGGWARLFPASWSLPVSGRGYARVLGHGVGRRFDGGRVALELRDVLVTGAGQDPASYRVIAGDFRLQLDPAHWRLVAKDVEFSRPGSPWAPSTFEAEATLADGRFERVSVTAPFISLSNLAPLGVLLPGERAREMALAADPSGELRNLRLDLAWTGPGRAPAVNGALDFRDLGFGALGKAPGLRGLNGRLRASGDTGLVNLDSPRLQFAWPTQFRDLIDARTVLTLGWRRSPNGVQLWVDDARLDTGHGRAVARLRLLLPDDGGMPLMDLAGTVTDAAVAQTWRYLPIGKLSPAALGWLDPAFRAGTVTHGTIAITGPVKGFPYRDGQGRFHAAAHVEGLTLDYARGWAPLQGATADAEFVGTAMHVRSTGGTVNGAPVGPAAADIDDWRESLLLIRAGATTPVAPLLGLLQQSPLGPTLGTTFMGLGGSGQVSGDVVMFLPIKHFEDRAITATARLEDVSLSANGLGEAVSHLNGLLTVNNRELYLPRFTGEFLGGALAGTLDTRRGPAGALTTVLNAQGTLDGARLQKMAKLPLNAGLDGRADWRTRLTIDRPGPQLPSRFALQFDSPLAGLAMALPGPFAKPAARAMPLSIAMEASDPEILSVRLALGDQTRGLLEWRRPQDVWQLDRGEVVFGGGREPSSGDSPGVRLRGTLPGASLSELLDLRWPEPSKRRVHEWLAGVDLTVGEAEALGYAFERPEVHLRPGNRAWEINLDGPGTRGRLVIPFEFPGEVPLVVDMERLHVGDRVRAGTGEVDPRRLPSIQFDARDFVFDERRFGHVRADLTRGTQGLSLGRLEVTHPDFRAAGRGSWSVDAAGAQHCSVSVEATTTNARGFLTAMGYGPWIEAKSGKARAEVTWPGPPDGRFYERLSGTIGVQLADGKIPEVEPGAGRVLGLMSIAHLPRRLALDFKDVTGAGLAFDSVGGDFTLRDGDAYTKNLTLRGPVAQIGVVGSTNLRTRQYDQTAVVTGDVGGTIGLAGALAAGPAVGAALLLFSRVFKEPLKGMTRGYYRISGPWEEPLVRRIDAQAAKQQGAAEAAARTPGSGDVP